MSLRFNGAYAKQNDNRRKTTKLDKMWNIASGYESNNNPSFKILVIRPKFNLDDIYGEPKDFSVDIFNTHNLFDTVDKLSPYSSRDSYEKVVIRNGEISFEDNYAKYKGEIEEDLLRLHIKAENGYDGVEVYRFIPKV